MSEAVAKHPEADVLVNFASLRSAYEATVDAMNHQQVSVLLPYLLLFSLSLSLSLSLSQFKCIAIIAEGIPENLTKKLIKIATEKKVTIIGPATVSRSHDFVSSSHDLVFVIGGRGQARMLQDWQYWRND